jgi:AraC-like DNA-binding protein
VPWLERAPTGRLAGLIERLWLVEEEDLSAAPHLICPDGRMEIVVHLGDPMRQVRVDGERVQPRALVAGQITSALTIVPTGRIAMMGARFAPGAFHACLPESQSRFTEQIVDCESMFSVWTRDTVDRLVDSRGIHDSLPGTIHDSLPGTIHDSLPGTQSEARGFVARLATFERALEDLFPRNAAVDRPIAAAVARLHATGGRASIRGLASGAGLSRRQFERRFHEHVGLSPRLFGRIIKFQRAFQLLGRESGAAIAAGCGYVDQAHLVREMRRFAGQTPSALAKKDDELTQFFRQ